jgi:outer membrane protein assembly factor BamE (lipoprotein component of BamABCDE complex)
MLRVHTDRSKEYGMTQIQSIRALMVAFVLMLGAGCATVGKDFATHKVDEITIGETTRSEVQAMFGDPWRTGIEDGKRTWTYGKYRWSAFGDAETTDLVVRFNEDGTVSSYVYNTTE